MVPYEQCGHQPIHGGKARYVILGGQRPHDVEQREEARGFHQGPPDPAGDVEAGLDGCLAHWVEGEQELNGGKLCILGVSLGSNGGEGHWDFGGFLTIGYNCQSHSRDCQCSRDGGIQASMSAIVMDVGVDILTDPSDYIYLSKVPEVPQVPWLHHRMTLQALISNYPDQSQISFQTCEIHRTKIIVDLSIDEKNWKEIAWFHGDSERGLFMLN